MGSRSHNVSFAKEQLKTILDTPGHPLKFLVDEKTGNWMSRRDDADVPSMQVGHMVSLHSGAPERLALQDSGQNQTAAHVGESRGCIFHNEAILIGGVPVEKESAQQWERLGKLPEGTVAAAEPHPGWSPEYHYAPDPPGISTDLPLEPDHVGNIVAMGVLGGPIGQIVGAGEAVHEIVTAKMHTADQDGPSCTEDAINEPRSTTGEEATGQAATGAPAESPAENPGHDAHNALLGAGVVLAGGAGLLVAAGVAIEAGVAPLVRIVLDPGVETAGEPTSVPEEPYEADEDPGGHEASKLPAVPAGAPPAHEGNPTDPGQGAISGDQAGATTPEPSDGGLPIGGVEHATASTNSSVHDGLSQIDPAIDPAGTVPAHGVHSDGLSMLASEHFHADPGAPAAADGAEPLHHVTVATTSIDVDPGHHEPMTLAMSLESDHPHATASTLTDSGQSTDVAHAATALPPDMHAAVAAHAEQAASIDP